MKFKPAKSRSLVLRKGTVNERARFTIGRETIPTVREEPIKCLGKWFHDTLKDKASIADVVNQTKTWMTQVERSRLPGKYKVWCYQHGVLPRLLWPLLVYEVPMSTVDMLEGKINTFLHQWLNVPTSLSRITLFSTGSKLQLPLKSVTEELKVAKVHQVMLL